MKIEMEMRIKFNRDVNLSKDYVVPGGYEFVMNGKTYHFDFKYMERSVCPSEQNICVFNFKDIDYSEFPEAKNLTVDDLKNISEIKDLYVYLGEEGETDLDVEEFQSITFYTPYVAPYNYDVPTELIAKYNKSLKGEIEKGIYEMKVPNPDLKEKIMAQQLVFYSRLMGISLEELCGHTIKELEGLLDCTLMQMPDETLQKFIDEIEGGKAEE